MLSGKNEEHLCGLKKRRKVYDQRDKDAEIAVLTVFSLDCVSIARYLIRFFLLLLVVVFYLSFINE